MGTGIPMSKGEIALKCNFAFIDDETGVILRYFFVNCEAARG